MRAIVRLCLVAGSSTSLLAQTGDERSEVERLERALDGAVRAVSRPRLARVVSVGGQCRSYRLPGYGHVFVLAPRSLPGPMARVSARPGHGDAEEAALAAAAQGDMQRRLDLLRAQLVEGAPDARRTVAAAELDEVEVRAVEDEARALDREAETAREEAERALEQLTRELRRMRAAPVAAAPDPPPLAPAAPPAPSVAAPAPPWRSWFQREADEAPFASADQTVRDVRSVVVRVLTHEGPQLRSLGPEEQLVVAVDFIAPAGAADRPQRTLVVRARKGDLDSHAGGQLSSGELDQRIQILDY